jgi:hypothetical protein
MLSLTPFLTFASSNYRLVEAFNTGEALQFHFIYIPTAFRNATVTWGGTRPCLSSGSCGYERVLTRGELTVYTKPARLAEWSREEPRGASRCS